MISSVDAVLGQVSVSAHQVIKYSSTNVHSIINFNHNSAISKSKPVQLLPSLNDPIAHRVHIQSLNCRMTSIYPLQKASTHRRQFVAP